MVGQFRTGGRQSRKLENMKIKNKKRKPFKNACYKIIDMEKKKQKKILHELYIELVKLQKEIIHSNLKLLVIVEGRDAAGKDGTIKTIIKHLSPRETRVVALGKPSNQSSCSLVCG